MDREQIAADLKRDEGWRASAYRDSEGYLTIGYGFLIDPDKNGQLPREIGDIWLNFNLDRLAASMRAAFPEWEQYPAGIQRALANMAYQMGISGLLGFRNTLRLIDERRYRDAAVEVLDSVWAHQTPNRARRVAGWIKQA